MRAENALKLMILSDRDAARWSAVVVPTESLQVEGETVDVPAALERALAKRPELEEASALLQRRRAESRSASDAARPKLDAVARYDRYGLAGSSGGSGLAPFDGRFGESFTSLRAGDFHAASIGVVLELPIRNQEAEGARASAQAIERQAQAEAARMRKTVRAEVLDAAATLETAGQRIDAARAARQAAEVQLAAEKDRYATGLSTNFLVLTRQNDLSRARLDEIAALTDYRMARTELARATGTLTTERGFDLKEPKGQENER
jgi:outer membrane protein TolC